MWRKVTNYICCFSQISPKSLQITILAERYMPAQMQETKWFYLQTWYLSFLLHGQDFQIPNWIAKVNENTKNFHFFQSNNKNCDKSESQKMLKKISEQWSRRVVTWMFHVLQFYWKHPTKVKSPTNATNAFIHQFFLVNWRNIWRGSTLERREKNATSVILPKSLRNHLKIHSGEKSFKCNQCDSRFSWAGTSVWRY